MSETEGSPFSVPADGPRAFNASVFFLLYFNRVFASIVSWGLRTWTWHQYRVYIDIQALQISLLGGRIFFTGLRYHGNNETILVQSGYITWAYWLRRVREVNVGQGKQTAHDGDGDDGDGAPEDLVAKLPCRIHASLFGLEWFVYNRSPAYDSILSGLTESQEVANETAPKTSNGDGTGDDPTQPRRRRSRRRRYEASDNISPGQSSDQTGDSDAVHNNVSSHNGMGRKRTSTFQSSGSDNGRRDDNGPKGADDLPLLLQLFPVHLQCEKAALVMGNENTKAILIVKAESMSGEIDASETTTPDPYRQFFRLKFKHPVIEMKENQDFKEDQAERATRGKQTAQESIPLPHRSFFQHHRRNVLGRLRNMVPYWRRSVESFSDSGRGTETATSHIPGSHHWQGLSRYIYDDGDDQKARWTSLEYAAVSTILDSPEASLTIFWDVVGKVQRDSASAEEKLPRTLSNINGDEPPAWAIHLSIKGGSVNYGPWADRQRADLQRIFVPNLCKDAAPATRLPLGADRVPTQFKLYVELEDAVTIRIPTREESKNWRWKGKEPGPKQDSGREAQKSKSKSKKSDPQTAHQRPYGWLDIKVAANATITYSMDMTASTSGFSNSLSLDLPSTEISSSINHELLWRSGRQRISCDLSTPLRWNALRQWHFKVASKDLELFLLRDHVFLLTDLLENVRLYLNLNDANIIDNPTDLDDNTYFVIASPLLQVKTCIPIDTYRPKRNTIPFDIRADTGSVETHVPPWNTQASFLSSREVGHLENFVVDGSYNYNTTTSPSNTDTLILNITGQSLVVCLHGFVVRYGMKVKDNYFGEDVHFKTLEEYQEILRVKESNPEAEIVNKPPSKKSNDLDVILSLRADDPKILLPANLYSSRRHIQIDTASLSLDLRFTSYYMELDLVLAPLNLSLGNTESGMETPISATSSTQLFIDGLTVYGHRLFGLPPAEPTYLCNWDLSVGAVTGECTVEFLTTLIRGQSAFGFSFDDDENALISPASIVMYDVTFFRTSVQSVCLWLHIEEAAFLFSTGPITADYNDWARSHYSKRTDIKIPNIKLSCINAESATRHKSRPHHPVETDALVETSLCVSIIGRKFNFSTERKLQQELVHREDQRTRRTPFLMLTGFANDIVPEPVDPPAQSVPPVPLPTTAKDIEDDRTTLNSMGTSRRSPGLRHKSSFLSLASSESSIVRPSRQSSAKATFSGGLHPLSSTEPRSGRNKGPSMHTRELSASTRHSAFYSATGDHNDRQDVVHNTVAFSSQYFAPYFPLENLEPNHREAMKQSIEKDDDERMETESAQFDLRDIDPNILSEDCAYSSTLVEMPSGLTAFCNPTALRYVVALISALQPSEPDDILDYLQVDSMKEIFDMQKDQKMNGHINDLLIRIPRANIRFINASELNSSDSPGEEQDQYDATVTKLAFASRAETRWEDSFKPESKETRRSFHLRLKSVGMSAAERCNNMDSSQAAVMGQIENVMVSLGDRDVTYLDVDVGNIQGSTSSEKIEYLASLIHRTGTLGSDLGRLFSEAASREKSLTKCLVQRLVGGGQEAPDPAFLIRPSAVLRSAPHHLRTFDSWKLTMRLRQMWAIRCPNDREHIRFDCLGPNHDLIPELRQEVVHAFEKWRSWDLENLSESVLLNIIFGPKENMPKPASQKKPTLAVAKIKRLQLILDPGPKQNEVAILDLTARLETKNIPPNQTVGGGADTGERTTILNIYCGDGAVNLNWELCELADGILKLANKMQSEPDSPPEKVSVVSSQSSPKKTTKQSIHCVVSLGRGSFAFEAINLHSSSFGNGMKASLLSRTGADDLIDTNFIFSCDSVTSSLRSHSQGLAKFSMEKPSLFVSHEFHATQTTDSHIIKATANSKYLSLAVKQDPINLAEVLDLVVRDEISQLYRLKNRFPSSTHSPSPAKRIVDRLSAFRVNVAMFMDQYTISLPLLRSLTYTVHGTVARMAMAANFGTEIIFDFDIKENSHEMQTKVNNVSRSISLLQIPPTNGQIKSHMDKGEHSVSIFASLELVQLDASSVYSLLSALNRPEISNAITELQQQGKIIQEHIRDITGEDQSMAAVPAEKDSAVLAYAVHLTFAGLKVFGNSPLESAVAPLAHISFTLDSIHLSMANRVEQHGPTLAYPEFRISLRHIAFDIQKGSADAMTSCGNLAFGALITASSRPSEDGKEKRFFHVKSDGFEVNLFPDTVSTVVDLEYLRKLRQSKPRIAINDAEEEEEADIIDAFLSSITYTFEICDIHLNLQLQMIMFNIAYVSTSNARRLAFQASISLSIKNVQQASQNWNPVKNILGSRRLESLLVDADFAGAVVYLSGKKTPADFGQDDSTSTTTLRSPGLALKMEYRDNGREDPSLYAEVKIDASSNILYPSVVPLIMDISNIKLAEEESILTADPTAFSLSSHTASVQHVYSRESTGSFKVQSIVLSLMNSKHVSGTSGVSAILKVSPMEVSMNAKQLQDFMLFREIWLPRDVTKTASSPVAKLTTETSQGHLVQRYQQVAATAAFPWTATISISALKIVVDLGQALGKSTFSITEFWMIGIESTGRMSGFQALNETPMIQASVGFSQLRVKAAFDYQAFLVADITSLKFLMYNAVQIFGTTSSASQGVALYQAFQKLRKSVTEDKALLKSPISLDTDVVVTLKTLNLGVFPNTFSDHQRRIHSVLGLTLGQLRIGLAGVRNTGAPKTLSELSVEDVVQSATGSRGGTILKVPQVEASTFEGKVEALARTWGKELSPVTAIRVTGTTSTATTTTTTTTTPTTTNKITAEVKVPQSKYEYTALEPPWIGLNRDRLPNLTHQIVIVSLLELAGEVEDAYSRILGSS
ncbi:hypothetical protein B0T17DRAFT_526586 [Bombardia bombarda]|uniref:Protein CSF1 n=1 Tax=Bombardia bombarda TaxID=252184 RepID=A0AA39X9H9_9PEZI|nr:hypothetical protein B0T17DRAFT_526586 [Bombardia bombarda]